MSTDHRTLTFLTIPPEIRNVVYSYVFVPETNGPIPEVPEIPSPIAEALSPDRQPCDYDSKDAIGPTSCPRPPSRLDTLLTCRKVHREAQLLALSTTTFHLRNAIALPERFVQHALPLSTPKLAALKHLTLTARITQLRALNETWQGRPFGHSALRLETLTLVPQRPDAGNTAWAEVAELDQCHTLAHVLAETLKTLQGVQEVRVLNWACFGEAVWRLVYKHLVFKVWKWGGMNCGLRFECSDGSEKGEGAGDAGWFKVFLEQPGDGEEDCKGRDAAVEAFRLMGGEGTSPHAVAGMP